MKKYITDLIGADDAELLFNYFIATVEYFHVGKKKPIPELSNQSWAKLCWNFNGESIYIGRNSIYKSRNNIIVGLRQDGKPVRDISKMFELTTRQVYRVLKTHAHSVTLTA